MESLLLVWMRGKWTLIPNSVPSMDLRLLVDCVFHLDFLVETQKACRECVLRYLVVLRSQCIYYFAWSRSIVAETGKLLQNPAKRRA